MVVESELLSTVFFILADDNRGIERDSDTKTCTIKNPPIFYTRFDLKSLTVKYLKEWEMNMIY